MSRAFFWSSRVIFLDSTQSLTPVAEWLVWYSGLPMVLGLTLALIDLVFLFEQKRPLRDYRDEPASNARVTVALTAYNDEESIGEAVRDFLTHQRVARVIVVSNNSADRHVQDRRSGRRTDIQ